MWQFCQRSVDGYHYRILLGYSFSLTKMCASFRNVHTRTYLHRSFGLSQSKRRRRTTIVSNDEIKCKIKRTMISTVCIRNCIRRTCSAMFIANKLILVPFLLCTVSLTSAPNFCHWRSLCSCSRMEFFSVYFCDEQTNERIFFGIQVCWARDAQPFPQTLLICSSLVMRKYVCFGLKFRRGKMLHANLPQYAMSCAMRNVRMYR